MPCAFATTSTAARGPEGRRDVTGISEMVDQTRTLYDAVRPPVPGVTRCPAVGLGWTRLDTASPTRDP
jgi:hypothetical protein